MINKHGSGKINPETDDIELVKKNIEKRMSKVRRNAMKAENIIKASGKQKIIRVVLDD